MSHIHALPAGTELVSDFEIERVLGAGGFGITYLAREIALDRKVTIKEYFPGDFAARGNGEAAMPRSEDCTPDYTWGLDRFIEEAQTLAKFDHPNIVRVYRYFRANNTGYMVLHFEEGQSLKAWLQGLGRAARQAELDQILAPLLDALSVVHAAEFLHRDIAPDNIIIRTDGSPVLIDFGAARGDIAQHSRTVSALVKPGYSPYEQYGEIGRQQGPWTDIYALAATLYHVITGKRPPDAPSRVMKDEIKPARDAALSAYRPSFLRAIDHGLRIDIERRPQTIAEWRGTLLAPDPADGQRSWFGAKRADKAGVAADPFADLVAPATAQTRALSQPDGARMSDMAGAMPPPPDLPMLPDARGGRGRILDFLDGVRVTPREASKVRVDLPPSLTQRELEIAAARRELEALGSAAKAAAAPKKRAGLFGRGGAPEPAAPADVKPGDRPVEGRSRATGKAVPPQKVREATPQPIARAAQGKNVVAVSRDKRRPPQPRPARTKSRWRWFPIVTKLAVGVAVATVLVRLQQTLPHFEFSGASTVASSPAPASRTVTGSITQREATVTAPRRGAGEAPRVASADTGSIAARPIKRAPATLLLRTFEAHGGGTTAVQFGGGDRTLVTTGGDGTLKLWDAKSFGLVRTLELEHGPALGLAVSGMMALTGHENGLVALWDLTLGMQLKTFKRNDAPITSLTFAGADKFLAGANDWSVALWETATPSTPLHVFEGHGRDVLAVAYEPRLGLIASGGADRTVKLWEGKSLSHVRTYPRAKDFITAVAFSPDGESVLMGAMNGEVSLYSTSSRGRRRRYLGHQGRITSLTFIDGGREFVSASADGTVRLWNRREGRALQTYGSAGAKIANAAVSIDGRLIAAAKDNGTVQIWNGAVLD